MATLVLIGASGAPWEPRALSELDARPDLVVLRRCVDVDDLLAAATAGQAHVAVVDLGSPGLDAAAVAHLRAHGVRPVAVASGDAAQEAGRMHAARIGISLIAADHELDALPGLIEQAARGPVGGPQEPAPDTDRHPLEPVDDEIPAPDPVAPGRVIAVWGPAGAPGRTTLACGLAGELAARRLPSVLVDADPYGGAVAQQLGVLDEVSGLLAAARLATAGRLEERLDEVQRRLSAGLTVVTGLPRPDRWTEVRAGALEHLLDLVRRRGQVVVDTGFNLEDDLLPDLGGRPGRNHLTLAAMEAADAVVAVGTADPVGLSRLARGLADLRERVPGPPVHVVVNRMRGSLGWSEDAIAAMVAEFAAPASLHFVPDDPATVDRAAVTGRAIREVDAEAPAARALAAVATAVLPASATTSARGPGGRLAGLARGARAGRRGLVGRVGPAGRGQAAKSR